MYLKHLTMTFLPPWSHSADCHAQQRERFALREAWGSTAPAAGLGSCSTQRFGFPIVSFGASPTTGFSTVNAKAEASSTSTVWGERAGTACVEAAWLL